MAILLILMMLLPLAGSLVNGLWLTPRQSRRAGVISVLFAAASFVMALCLWISFLANKTPIAITFPWFNAGEFKVDWSFSYDALTAVMTLVVTGIGTLIHLYSVGYMSDDRSPGRYFAYLNLFLSAMLCLVCAGNLPVLFVGWEGVGACSYLLIGYWYQDLKNANAGMKAFLVNRIGDAGFLIGIFICYHLFHTLQFSEMAGVLSKSTTLDPRWLSLAALFLFVGACGKSAQIPLFVWLPDAMAGPTPVSALIHAATMVTAGVYLICRMNFLYMVTPDVRFVIATIGAVTALFAATIAIAQRDIKKVLAYSTVSQLGLMFVALGAGNYLAGIFHVITHAFFKALLFLGAGSVIHALSGEQDIFKMGGLRKHLPKTFITFAIATAAIAGVPPLSGFFSKDLILYSAATSDYMPQVIWGMASFASFLTAIYMTRLFAVVFLGQYRGGAHPHESPSVMTVPLVVLAVGSAVAGVLVLPESIGPNFLGSFLSGVLPEFKRAQGILSEGGAMAMATGFAFLGIVIALLLYTPNPTKGERLAIAFKPLHTILENKYWVDELYALVFVKPFRMLCRFLAVVVDPKVIDAAILFPTRVARVGADALGMFQLGTVQFYLLVMLMGTVVIFWRLLKGVVF